MAASPETPAPHSPPRPAARRSSSGASVRLYCLAHAGASTSSFDGWAARVGPGVEVVPLLLPGRGSRAGEQRVTDREALLADLMDHFVEASRQAPFALYGHSLGALVACTVAQALRDAGLPGPALLAVGACPPPTAPSPLSDAWAASESELVALLTEMGAVPDRALPGGFWYRTVLPVLRDDLTLGNRLRVAAQDPGPGSPFEMPLLVASGDRDPLARPSTMASWREWTTGPVALHTVPGDHYFVSSPVLPGLLGRACREVRDTGRLV